MISYLKGKPLVRLNQLIVLVNGVGYGVKAGNNLLRQADAQNEVSLHISTQVKQDSITLYGFLKEEELSLFEMLLEVSGVGPKTALNLVDLGTAKFFDAVQNARISFFTPVPRVGKKLAQKIIIELKPKLGSIKDLKLTPLDQKEQEVLDALVSLGFSADQVEPVFEDLKINELNIQEAIRKVLKKINGKT